MNPRTYNASIAAGVSSAAIGAGAQWGWPMGLMVAGALVLALAVSTLRMMRKAH